MRRVANESLYAFVKGSKSTRRAQWLHGETEEWLSVAIGQQRLGMASTEFTTEGVVVAGGCAEDKLRRE
jgi:hypothetical protein